MPDRISNIFVKLPYMVNDNRNQNTLTLPVYFWLIGWLLPRLGHLLWPLNPWPQLLLVCFHHLISSTSSQRLLYDVWSRYWCEYIYLHTYIHLHTTLYRATTLYSPPYNNTTTYICWHIPMPLPPNIFLWLISHSLYLHRSL